MASDDEKRREDRIFPVAGEQLSEADARRGETYEHWSMDWIRALPDASSLASILNPVYAWARNEQGCQVNAFAAKRWLRDVVPGPFQIVLPRHLPSLQEQKLESWSCRHCNHPLPDGYQRRQLTQLQHIQLTNGLNYTLVSPLVTRWCERLRRRFPDISPLVGFSWRWDLFGTLMRACIVTLEGRRGLSELYVKWLDIWRYNVLPVGYDFDGKLFLLGGIIGNVAADPVAVRRVR